MLSSIVGVFFCAAVSWVLNLFETELMCIPCFPDSDSVILIFTPSYFFNFYEDIKLFSINDNEPLRLVVILCNLI